MDLREIHNRFFSFRNGIVAKTFHDAGSPHARIFGLQLPQLGAIAREAGYDEKLARQLWSENDCREARLLACYLFDPETITEEEALEMAKGVVSREEADILSWRLLRRMPEAPRLLGNLEQLPEPPLGGYMAEALKRNLDV